MASSEGQQEKEDSDESLKLAVAMAILRSKLFPKPPPQSSSSPSHSDAQKWKRKAKERKLEILRLKEYLKEAEDGLHHDLFPETASCKCYFFDRLGNLELLGGGYDQRFNDVLRRRFLRQVRLKERKRKTSEGSAQGQRAYDYSTEGEMEQLRASVDFLVELCDTVTSLEDTNFANWSHQAVDFILDAIKNPSLTGKHMEQVEGIASSLIMNLSRRMCTTLQGNGKGEPLFNPDAQFYVQHLLRKLGTEPCIGQRVILAVSQRISVLAEKLLFIDPFDEAFPDIHSCLYIMIQLIELLLSDYFVIWSQMEGFDTRLCEEWMMSMIHARKGLELLESRNGLYALYMDRVMGVLAKCVGQISSLQKLNPEILESLFH